MRPHRSVTKRLNRAARATRRDLVHAAGCSMRFHPFPCSSTLVELEDLTDEPRPIRVPRSLRSKLGVTVGGPLFLPTEKQVSSSSHLCGTNLHRGETDGRGDSDSFELVHCPRCRNLVIATGEPVCVACQEGADER